MTEADWSKGTRTDYDVEFSYIEIDRELSQLWQRIEQLYRKKMELDKTKGNITKDCSFDQYLELQGVVRE